MQYGIVNGDMDGVLKVVYDSGELSSSTQTVTATGFDGNDSGEYYVFSRIINGNTGSVESCEMRFNSDSSNHYGECSLNAFNGSVSSFNNTQDSSAVTGMSISYTRYKQISLGVSHIFSDLNKVICCYGQYTAIDDPTQSNYLGVFSKTYVWNTTDTNLTSISFSARASGGLGIGTRFIILKKNKVEGMTSASIVANSVEKSWGLVYNSTISSATNSVAISSLDGDSDIFYRVRMKFKCPVASNQFSLRLNNDTGSNYKYEKMFITTSRNAANVTSGTDIYLGDSDASSETQIDFYIYAKSGYARSYILEGCYNTKSADGGSILRIGGNWQNTSSNLTSINLRATQSTGIGVGSEIQLWKLNV